MPIGSATEMRKLSHIRVTLKEQVQSGNTNGLDDVNLIHRSLPEIDRGDIDTSTALLDHKLGAPIMIESMTGGTHIAAKINGILAKVAEEFQVPMGVGSQRAALEDKRLAYTYNVTRENAPSILLFANLGCPQLIKDDGIERAQTAVEMIDANVLFVHMNTLQESVQPEGETSFEGVLSRIRELTKRLNVPVVLKETGAGVSREVAKRVESVGVKGIDVSGAGGTSWAAVEYYRSKKKGNKLAMQLAKTYWDWGITTAASIVEVVQSTKLTVMASGGLRTGLHVAKCVGLRAACGGLALPFIKAASNGHEAARQMFLTISEELKTAMFLTGSRTISELAQTPIVIVGRTMDWLNQRGFSTSHYARRS